MLKILQASLQQYLWNGTFQIFKLDLEKSEESRDKIANISWIIRKNIYFCFIDYAKSL